jgi:hypothetical protein
MRGNIICLLALYGCIPMVLYFFSKYRPERAVIICFFGALMFLPMEKLNIPLIIYNKMTATAIGVMIAIKVYDSEKLEGATLHPVDIPMVFWCLSGFLASIVNGLGPKDGFQEAFNTFTTWGIPYIAGRLYFSNAESIKLLCLSIFAAGLIYTPFVLFELKMSPQAHRIVYGYMQHSFAQVMRGGGYRPMVFMEHGIMLGTWVSMGALVGLWCTFTKVFPKKMWHAPTVLLAVVLLGAAVACKSSGAIALCLMGFVVLVITAKLKMALLVWILLLIPPAYVGTRATGYWDGQNLVDFITEKFSADRAASLKFRFDNENILVEKALDRPLFGWGGWGRSRVYDEEGEDVSTTDGFWIIVLGTRGYFGLFSVILVLILPMFLFLLKCPPRLWGKPEYAPIAVISFIPLLFMIDCLLNGMVNQVYIIFAGGASGLLAKYGIAGLENQTLSGKDAPAVGPAMHPMISPTQRNMGALRFGKTNQGDMSAQPGVRSLGNPVLSGNAGGVGIRMGLAGIRDDDSECRTHDGNGQAHESVHVDRKNEQGTKMTNRAFKRGGPRNLQNPGKNLMDLMSPRVAARDQADQPGEPEKVPAEATGDDGDALRETEWVRRI